MFVAESLPRIESLARDGKFLAAFELARAVEQDGGAAAVSEQLWELASTRVSVVFGARRRGGDAAAVWS